MSECVRWIVVALPHPKLIQARRRRRSPQLVLIIIGRRDARNRGALPVWVSDTVVPYPLLEIVLPRARVHLLPSVHLVTILLSIRVRVRTHILAILPTTSIRRRRLVPAHTRVCAVSMMGRLVRNLVHLTVFHTVCWLMCLCQRPLVAGTRIAARRPLLVFHLLHVDRAPRDPSSSKDSRDRRVVPCRLHAMGIRAYHAAKVR